jgi:hypothetical protein
MLRVISIGVCVQEKARFTSVVTAKQGRQHCCCLSVTPPHAFEFSVLYKALTRKIACKSKLLIHFKQKINYHDMAFYIHENATRFYTKAKK